jgi:hypothetical protein
MVGFLAVSLHAPLQVMETKDIAVHGGLYEEAQLPRQLLKAISNQLMADCLCVLSQVMETKDIAVRDGLYEEAQLPRRRQQALSPPTA